MKAGERINDRYKLIREIGSGGMAKVFLAEDLILERQGQGQPVWEFQQDKIRLKCRALLTQMSQMSF